jgi:hypothetical protein
MSLVLLYRYFSFEGEAECVCAGEAGRMDGDDARDAPAAVGGPDVKGLQSQFKEQIKAVSSHAVSEPRERERERESEREMCPPPLLYPFTDM